MFDHYMEYLKDETLFVHQTECFKHQVHATSELQSSRTKKKNTLVPGVTCMMIGFQNFLSPVYVCRNLIMFSETPDLNSN